jgi:hypothetical protein
MLNPKHCKILHDLVADEGHIPIPADEAIRRQARNLVELGYVTIVPTGGTSLAIEITERGRTAKVLADFGIWSPDFCAIEPQPSEPDDKWVIKVSSLGGPPTLIDVADATKLVRRLMEVGEIEIARRFQVEIERTRRYMNGRLCIEID